MSENIKKTTYILKKLWSLYLEKIFNVLDSANSKSTTTYDLLC